MSEQVHIHVNRGINRRYVAVVRPPGGRNYRMIGKWTKSQHVATMRLAKAMLDTRWKLGAVLFISDHYDPTPILRMER